MKTLRIATLAVAGLLVTRLTVFAQGGPTTAPRGAAATGTPISADCPVYAAAPAGTLTAAEARRPDLYCGKRKSWPTTCT
jgi:hypothetical protein